jgi:hypothetical protein
MTLRRNIQLFRHKPEVGIYGDCYRTVISCLLCLDPEAVPHVSDAGATADDSDAKMNAFLRERGFTFIEFPLSGGDLGSALDWTGRYFKGMHHTLSGISKNGVGHFVICKDGEIVHDTSIDQSGIVGPHDGGHFWIGFVVGIPPCDLPATNGNDASSPSVMADTQDETESCPVCGKAFVEDDLCATDIELGICHAECLDGCPVVDLDTGEVIPGGAVHKYRYGSLIALREVFEEPSHG